MNKFNFLKEVEEVLDEQFPKGKCKERGNALVLFAMVNLKFKEFIRLLKEEIDILRDYKGGDGSVDNPIHERFLSWKDVIEKIDKFAEEDLIK